jgi:FMN phosphatase YigB (HAD superfamily)
VTSAAAAAVDWSHQRMSSLVVFDFDETLIPVDSDRYVVQNLSGDRWPELQQAMREAAKQQQWTMGMDDAMAALHSFGVSEAQITGIYVLRLWSLSRDI